MASYSSSRFPVSFAIVSAVLSLAASPHAGAQEVSFAGKRVNALIGATPGGGTDLTTRLVGRYMEKYLPGQPRVIYRNMPAGNGVQATNYFANEAKRDGTYWMGGGNAYIDAQAMRQPVVKYDPRTFHFLGGIARGGSLMNLRKEKVANLTDRNLPPIIIGTGDGTDTWAEMMCWGAEYLGWNMRFVVGYPGTAAIMLSLRRGEIDSFGTSSLSMLSSLRKQGAYKEIVQIGQMQNGKVVPRGYAPDVPTMASLLDGKLSGVAQASFRYWSDSNQIDKWYALPPETPAPVVSAYRTAYLKVVADPDFIKHGRAQISPDFGYQTADDITRLARDTSYPSAEITAFMLKLRVKYGLPGQPLSEEELAKLAAKLVGEAKKVKSALSAVENGGRVVKFKASGGDHKANVSGSRTKVTIAGKEASRSALKAGMACEISYSGNGGEATAIHCN